MILRVCTLGSIFYSLIEVERFVGFFICILFFVSGFYIIKGENIVIKLYIIFCFLIVNIV